MGKYKRDNTVATITKKYKEGRGQGDRENYKPWLTIHDIASSGDCSRYSGWVTGRVHHVFSTIEKNVLLLLDWQDDVVDIKEQYPLLDEDFPSIEETRSIADHLGFRHPRHPFLKEDIVMTTDFVVTRLVKGREISTAYCVKQKKDLQKLRNIQKLEIERVYWSTRDIRRSIIHEEHIDKTIIGNLEFIIHSKKWFEINGYTRGHVRTIEKELLLLPAFDVSPLWESCKRVDRKLGLASGTAINAIKYLISYKIWRIDMKKGIRLDHPLHIIERSTVW